MINKSKLIDICSDFDIIPSIIYAISINITNNFSSKLFRYTNNCFNIPVDKKWYGKCFSKNSGIIYDNYTECKENGAILYRSYDSCFESVKDFILYIKNYSASENGPCRYDCIFGMHDYKEILNDLIELDFPLKCFNISNYNAWYNDIISIIEKNKLFELDKEMEDLKLSKKNKKRDYSGKGRKNDITVIDFDHMYRVRLAWDKPDTQIFASPVYADALEQAKSHEGYKIYIDDDGELFEDPWANTKIKIESNNIPGIRSIIHPIAGKSIELKNELAYKNAIDKASFMSLTGTYYFYDSSIINNRAKITTHKNLPVKDPKYILGYIKIR